MNLLTVWSDSILNDVVMIVKLLKKHDLPKCSLHAFTDSASNLKVLQPEVGVRGGTCASVEF